MSNSFRKEIGKKVSIGTSPSGSLPAGLNVLKRNGSVQPFDRNKLVNSMKNAGATQQQAKLVSNRVVTRLGDGQTIQSSQLSSMAARSLGQVNPTASGKYTVYRDQKLRSPLAPTAKSTVFSSVSLPQSAMLKPKMNQATQTTKPPANPTDISTALTEIISAVGDELSASQDKVSQEAHLGTARERVSIARTATADKAPKLLGPTVKIAIPDSAHPLDGTVLDTTVTCVKPLMVSLFQPDVERDLGQPIGLTATVSGGDGQYTFTWQSDDGSFWITTTPTSTFTPLYDGSYAIIVLVKDGSGASGISNKVFVKVNPQLKIALNPYFILTNGIVQNTQNMDMGQLARFTAIIWGGTAPYSVAWYVNGKHEGSSFIGGPGICEWDFTAPATGKYYVYAKVYDRYQQSVDSQVASLQVYAALTVNVTPDNKTMPSTMVSDVTLTAHVQGGLGPYSYIWHSDKFGTITIGPTMSTTADYTYNTPHTQLWKDIVTLDVYDSNGTSVKAQPIPIIVFPVTLPP